jgi:hypothetical protein
MTDRNPTGDDAFETELRESLGDYAAGSDAFADPYAIADGMLQVRARRPTRVGLAAASGVLAAAVLAGIAIGSMMLPRPLATSPSSSMAPSAAESSAPSRTASAAPAATPSWLPGQAAPEACGFPDGAALSFAGRSTTATLGVQEVVGDPMSDDPADIYITRDRYDRGELRGRLVCAIYPGQDEAADFVEVTLHPADGGRFSLAPEPSSTPPPDGLSRDEAISVAHALLPAADGWEVAVAEAGPLGRVLQHFDGADWAVGLAADLWVWRVFLVSGGRGTDVVIDYVDGSVHGTIDYIVN